jgi:hypothetical protein
MYEGYDQFVEKLAMFTSAVAHDVEQVLTLPSGRFLFSCFSIYRKMSEALQNKYFKQIVDGKPTDPVMHKMIVNSIVNHFLDTKRGYILKETLSFDNQMIEDDDLRQFSIMVRSIAIRKWDGYPSEFINQKIKDAYFSLTEVERDTFIYSRRRNVPLPEGLIEKVFGLLDTLDSTTEPMRILFK